MLKPDKQYNTTHTIATSTTIHTMTAMRQKTAELKARLEVSVACGCDMRYQKRPISIRLSAQPHASSSPIPTSSSAASLVSSGSDPSERSHASGVGVKPRGASGGGSRPCRNQIRGTPSTRRLLSRLTG